jgi:hypothetical protein
MTTRFVLTYVDADGLRVLQGPNQGRRFATTHDEAFRRLRQLYEANTPKLLASVYGAKAPGTFEVTEAESYEHGDLRRIIFDQQPEPPRVSDWVPFVYRYPKPWEFGEVGRIWVCRKGRVADSDGTDMDGADFWRPSSFPGHPCPSDAECMALCANERAGLEREIREVNSFGLERFIRQVAGGWKLSDECFSPPTFWKFKAEAILGLSLYLHRRCRILNPSIPCPV